MVRVFTIPCPVRYRLHQSFSRVHLDSAKVFRSTWFDIPVRPLNFSLSPQPKSAFHGSSLSSSASSDPRTQMLASITYCVHTCARKKRSTQKASLVFCHPDGATSVCKIVQIVIAALPRTLFKEHVQLRGLFAEMQNSGGWYCREGPRS